MPDRGHGTRGRYVRGCRCEPCTAANRIYQRQWNANQNPADMPSSIPHGTRLAYKGWRCRCTPCRAWNARQVAQVKATRAAEQETRP